MGTSWKGENVTTGFDKYNDMLEEMLGFHFLFEIIQSDKSIKTILDYGCGPGKVSARLAALKRDYDVIAVDESPNMLEIALSKRKHEQIDYRLISNDSMPFLADNSIDCAIICFVIINNGDENRIQKIINEVYRVLKPNGKFLILDSNPEAVGIKFTTFQNGDKKVKYTNGAAKKQFLKIDDEPDLVLNDYYWTKDFYEKVLSKAGFEVERVIESRIGDIPDNIKAEFERKYQYSNWQNEVTQAPFIIFQVKKEK